MYVSALVLNLALRFENINHHRSESIYLYSAVGKKTSGEHEYLRLFYQSALKKERVFLKLLMIIVHEV